MADFSPFKIDIGDTDYPAKVNSWQKDTELTLSEVQSAREGQANLLTRVQGLTHNTMTANLNAQNSFFAINFPDPVNTGDLANRQFVLASVAGGGDPFDIGITQLNKGTAKIRQFIKISPVSSEQPEGFYADFTLVTTGTFTAEPGHILALDSRTNSQTVTLPASPVALDDRVSFVDVASSWVTNHFTVARNGHLIMGIAEDLTVDESNRIFELTFISNSLGWRLT